MILRIGLLLLIACASPLLAQRQRNAQPLAIHEGRYYQIHTDISTDELREAELRMSRMAEEYYNRTRDFAGRIQQKFPFLLFRSEQDYLAAGGMPGSAGIYDGNTRTLMAIAGEQVNDETWHTIQHEGFHQFADAVIGGELPIWVNEGLAEYFGEALFTGDSFVVGVVPAWRLERIRKTIAANRFLPFEQFMTQSHEQWNKRISVTNYDQAWALVHFMVHANQGKYRDGFAAFIRDVSRGRDWQRAWMENLGPADGLEQAWRTYWQDLPKNASADLYAEATVRAMTSYLARATAQRQRFANFSEFLTAAVKNELKISEQNWLPPSLLRSALEGAMAMKDSGDVFTLSPASGAPQLIVQRRDRSRMIGAFRLKSGMVTEVTVTRR